MGAAAIQVSAQTTNSDTEIINSEVKLSSLDTSEDGVKLVNGTYCMYKNGEVDTTFNGAATAGVSVRMFTNGVMDKNYTGMAYWQYSETDGMWIYFENGTYKALYTGTAKNDEGYWYFEKGSINTNFTGWLPEDGVDYWYENNKRQGLEGRGKEIYDPSSDAWYWFDADGTMACSKDVYIPESNENREVGKWVRYDADGRMVKGYDARYGGNYYFDEVTGEMKKGFAYVKNWNSWGYFDDITGQARVGESFINDNWYRFGSEGRMIYGFFSNEEGNSYYYDLVTGVMLKGEFCIKDNWYYADEITGILAKGECYHNESWYYYDPYYCYMKKGIVKHDTHEYYYDLITGVMQYGAIYHDNDTYYYDLVTGVRVAIPISQEDEEKLNYEYARECLNLQNDIRIENGVAPLEWDEELYNEIKIRGVEISQSFSHTRPNGNRCFSVIVEAHYGAGENIANGYRSPEAVTDGWYNSEGHRSNMLASSFKKAAVVAYKNSGRIYWVTMFIG